MSPRTVRMPLLAVFLLALSVAWQPAAACSPNPPRPAILEGHAYDRMAAEYLARDARSVVAARLALRIDLEMAGADPSPGRAQYVFDALEGWGEITPRRLTIGGQWVSCALVLQPGRVFLLFLQGERLLHAVPVEQIDFELAVLGEPAWFYDARGRLIDELGD